ncbi:MAG: arginyltransferase [Methylococcales bacterium]|nr:arginyltransferase [Methylococcales bacterium]
MTSISLTISNPQKCSYLEDKTSQSAFVYPRFLLDSPLYSKLLVHGFRRSGNEVYSPRCSECAQCISCRIPVQSFKASRNQKRCLKKNNNTKVIIQAPVFKQQHFDLYLRYQQFKHPDSIMATTTSEEYIQFLSSDWCTTSFVEFFIDNQLAAVAVVDFLDQSLSAVYTFFEPSLSAYSLGVYAVLWQIEHAHQLNLTYVYLGYWVEQCQKMAYKTHYQPLEGFINQQWQLIT